VKHLKDKIIEQLKTVIDPELGLDIYTLGLIYDINVDGKNLQITMTFTSPQCPFGPMILEQVKACLSELPLDSVNVDLTFTPPWQPSQELRALLGV
jgi:metal-sulfur cluster biosynthetic enzyme